MRTVPAVSTKNILFAWGLLVNRSFRSAWCLLLLVFLVAGGGKSLFADDILVTNRSELISALSSAAPGDRILLAPGTYAGGYFANELTDVVIRSQFPDNRAIISGGTNGFQLSDPNQVTMEYLVFEDQEVNGLNIDDGGTFDTPATQVTIREITIRGRAQTGNRDGIKLSGVNDFVVDRVDVSDWGGGGGVDMVGCHDGLIRNSFFHQPSMPDSGQGIQAKGGSKNIVVRANRFEFLNGNGRAVQAGGSTGTPFFRFVDGDSGYEAAQVRVEGNVILRGESSFIFHNIDGGIFHRNYAWRPQDWLIRILNPDTSGNLVATKNGRVEHNVLVFNDTATEYKRAVNIGPGTEPETFQFIGNQWYNLADPANSEPMLPTPEVDGIYGVEPEPNPDDVIPWKFDWGWWLVNAHPMAHTYDVATPSRFVLVTPGANGHFDPLSDDPFSGRWQVKRLPSNSIELDPFSQAFLVDRKTFAGLFCLMLSCFR